MIVPKGMSSFEKIAAEKRKITRSAEGKNVNVFGNSIIAADVAGSGDNAATDTNSKLPVAIITITDAIAEFDTEIPRSKRLKKNDELSASHDTSAIATELMQGNAGAESKIVLTYDELNYSPPTNDKSTEHEIILQKDNGEKECNNINMSKDLTQLMVPEETELAALLTSDEPPRSSEYAPNAEIAVVQETAIIQSADGDKNAESSNDRDILPVLRSVNDFNQINTLVVDRPNNCQSNVSHLDGEIGKDAIATNIWKEGDIQESIIVMEPASQGQLNKSFNLLRDLPSQKGQDLSVTITSKDQKFAFSFKTSISKMKGVFLRMLQNVVEMYRVLAENGTGTSIKHVIFIRSL